MPYLRKSRVLCRVGAWVAMLSSCLLMACQEAVDAPPEILRVWRLGQGAPSGLYVYGEEILVEFDRDPGDVQITYDGAPGPDVAGDGTTRVFVVLKQAIVLTWEGGSETLEYQSIFEQEVGPVLVAADPAVDGPPESPATVNADGIALRYNVRLWDPDRTIQPWWFTTLITDARGVTWTPQVTHDGDTVFLKPPPGDLFLSGETYTVTVTGDSAFNDWFDFSNKLVFTFE